MPAAETTARPGGGEARHIRRVLVALDSSTACAVTLEVAASLAAATASELSGLFVEDQDLLHLAGLPFAREVQLGKVRPGESLSRDLDPAVLLRDLRAQAAVAREAMAKQAALHRLAWSFQVAKGRSEEALLLAAAAGDVIAVARGFGPMARFGRISREVRLIAARAPGPLLLAGAGGTLQAGPVLLPYDASPAAEHMLAIAADLAVTRRAPLEIMLLGETAPSVEDMAGSIRAAGGREPLPPLQIWIPRDRRAALHRLCALDRGLLVLPADEPWFENGQVEQIIERAKVPIVLQTEKAPSPA
ncbi:hypothetical protein AAFN88_07010 [Pelagibius sp. CAU 1746]|uniref:hypothetical protein n=1 Tax=Pelagibius sp. CAU 1746 TaxID=3140370 RepID=UPI00325BC86C